MEEAKDLEIYTGSRGNDFKSLINNLLIKGRIKQKYIDLLLDDDAMKIYGDAFTSDNVNPENNYQFYEQLGDVIGGQFLVWYAYRTFPILKCAEGVQIVARIKITYGATKTFSSIAEKLGFWNYISTTGEDRLRRKKPLLEDVFEAFLGATAYILDNTLRNGVGYAVCYEILENIFNELHIISLKYEKLYDAKTRVKEMFDFYKDLGQVKYEHNKVDRISYVEAYRLEKNGNRILMGKGSAALKDDAEQNAASYAIEFLKKMYPERKPKIYTTKPEISRYY